MITTKELLQNFVHLGALLYFVCFLFRNQILLRSFAIAADVAYLIYYYNAAEEPLWGAVFWNVLLLLVNGVMLALIVRDNHTTGFTGDELKLYRALKVLSPADFRKIARVGRWRRADADTVLATQGQPLHLLHYILEGEIDIEKNGRKIETNPNVFIGEIAFLRRCPASATVTAKPGTLYISWSHDDLHRAQEKHDSLRNAIASMLNSDLADKLARSGG